MTGILVTGSSRGIGAAIREQLEARCVRVIGHSTRGLEEGEIAADFTEPSAPSMLWEEALRQSDGEIDVAIPILRWGGEIDGPHHEETAQRAYDRRRDENLRSRWDWHVDRYPEGLVKDRHSLERRVEGDIRSIAAQRGIALSS